VSPPANALPRKRSTLDMSCSSFSEIQPQAMDLCPDNFSSAGPLDIVSQWPNQTVGPDQLPAASASESTVACGDEDGIELQEQGHAEMLEHALGELSCKHDVHRSCNRQDAFHMTTWTSS